jgi:hypothetical protein
MQDQVGLVSQSVDPLSNFRSKEDELNINDLLPLFVIFDDLLCQKIGFRLVSGATEWQWKADTNHEHSIRLMTYAVRYTLLHRVSHFSSPCTERSL